MFIVYVKKFLLNDNVPFLICNKRNWTRVHKTLRNSHVYQLILKADSTEITYHSWCSWSWPGINQRMLSVRIVAYMMKLIRNNKENKRSQSIPLLCVLGRGPTWSSMLTITSDLGCIPEMKYPIITLTQDEAL